MPVPLIFPSSSAVVDGENIWLLTMNVAGSCGENPVPEMTTVEPTAPDVGLRVNLGLTIGEDDGEGEAEELPPPVTTNVC